MRTTAKILAITLTAFSAVSLWPQRVAAVTDEEFQKLQQQFQELQKQRQEDRKEIDQLKEKLGETQKTATESQKKAEEAQKTASEAATKVQPVTPVPGEEAQAKSNFLLTGYAHALYGKTEGEHGSFELGSFNPIFLYRAGDKVLFEGELELEVMNAEGGGADTELMLEYAQMDYLFNDYVTVVAGKMLLPLGTFIEKIHPAWINKLPTFPLPRADETAILPESGVGLQLRGAFSIGGDHRLTYAVYGVNGPGSKNGTGNADDLDLEGNVVDQNDAPSAGGRISWFYPWKPYNDVEIGVAGQSGVWNNNSDLLWSAFVVDAALHLGPDFEARGEYINTWQETNDAGTIQPHGWWAQAAYKLAGLNLDLPMINNTEVVFRYSMVDDDQPGTRTHAYALGFVYYITSQFQFKGAYEFITSTEASEANNRLLLQMAYGF